MASECQSLPMSRPPPENLKASSSFLTGSSQPQHPRWHSFQEACLAYIHIDPHCQGRMPQVVPDTRTPLGKLQYKASIAWNLLFYSHSKCCWGHCSLLHPVPSTKKHKRNSSLLLVPGFTVRNYFSLMDTMIPFFESAAQKLNMRPTSSKCVKA